MRFRGNVGKLIALRDTLSSDNLGRTSAISKSIFDRVGCVGPDVATILELPCSIAVSDVVGLVSDVVVAPAPPPYIPDDESSALQQCPRCLGLIIVDDAGISFCYSCNHLICVGDGLSIIHFDPLPFHCPICGAASENYCEATEFGEFFCQLCGQIMNWSEGDCDGFQLTSTESMGGTP